MRWRNASLPTDHGLALIAALAEEALVVPTVLADDDADPPAGDHDDVALGRRVGLEVTRLVEDVVRRQQRLGGDDAPRAAVQQRDGVVQRPAAAGLGQLVAHDAADEHRQAGGHGARQLGERGVVRGEEARPHQQVLRRIAADRQLGEHRQLGAAGLRARGEAGDAPGVAGQVADRRVDLAEGDAHAFTALRAAG